LASKSKVPNMERESPETATPSRALIPQEAFIKKWYVEMVDVYP
jgi:hypothetical protein